MKPETPSFTSSGPYPDSPLGNVLIAAAAPPCPPPPRARSAFLPESVYELGLEADAPARGRVPHNPAAPVGARNYEARSDQVALGLLALYGERKARVARPQVRGEVFDAERAAGATLPVYYRNPEMRYLGGVVAPGSRWPLNV